MTDVTVMLPSINTFGFWEFKEPFYSYIINRYNINIASNKLLLISTTALKDLDLITNNVYESIYQSVNLNRETYTSDLSNNIPVLTFNIIVNKKDIYFKVPLNYVSSIPANDEVTYRNKALVLDLGVLPDNIDLSIWKQDYLDFTLGRIGVIPQFKEVQIGTPTFFSTAMHNTNEVIRNNTRTINDSILLQFEKLKTLFDELNFKYKKLSDLYSECRLNNPLLTNFNVLEKITTQGIVTQQDVINYVTINNVVTTEVLLTHIINTNTVTKTQLVTYIRDNNLLTGNEILTVVPLDQIQTFVDTNKDELINNLLKTIYELSAGISSLVTPIVVPDLLTVVKGTGFNTTINADVPDGTKYYWSIYKPDNSVKLFKQLTGSVTITNGKGHIYNYVQSIELVTDTPVYITLRVLPNTPEFLTISPVITISETIESIDNYGYLFMLDDLVLGTNVTDYSDNAANRNMTISFYE